MAEPTKQDKLYAMRHSLAHIMAAAVQRLWPEAKFGVGPVIENGFYYDIDLGKTTISEENFKQIEKEMDRIIKEDQAFEKSEMPVNEALAWAKKSHQPYKEELLNDLKREGTTFASELDTAMMGLPSGISGVSPAKVELSDVSFYKNGDFTDLCRGPHVASTGKVGDFKLMRVAGAYWRGSEKNPQMQRLYGVAFETEKELRQHLAMLEEAKKRDHRKLGLELDLFTFSDLIGPGLPLWTPRGTIVRNELDNYVQELRGAIGFQPVTIPHITKKDLYEKSGHWSKFSEELFHIETREGHEFVMKPMNCPHHTQIFAARPRSYRDLPIRYRETTMCYRDEQTGELNGLSRVRSFTQDDAHVFCREEQIESEVLKLWQVIQDFYGVLDFPLSLRFSSKDPETPEAYAGEPKKWEKAENELRKVVAKQKDMTIEDEGVGEAAFYGPKLDFMAKDSLGRQWQVATIQLDFAQPEGLDLKYADETGNLVRPVMVHCAVMGSIERFISVYIEHSAGKFPVWLAPEQVRIITVNQEESTVEFAKKLATDAIERGLRIEVDNTNESVGKKIRAAELMKVPYTVVIGEKEIESNTVTPRIRNDMQGSSNDTSLPARDFLEKVTQESKDRANKSTL